MVQSGKKTRLQNEVPPKSTDKTDKTPSQVLDISEVESKATSPTAIEKRSDREIYNVLSAQDIYAINTWLTSISETDQAIIDDTFKACCENSATLKFIHEEVRKLTPILNLKDDRHHCHQCQNLTPRGLCLAARRGEINADRNYYPNDDLPRRCGAFVGGG